MTQTTSKRFCQIEYVFFFTMIVLLFQVTRNLSNILYIVVLFSLYSLLFAVFIKNKKLSEVEFKPIELFFLLSLIWVPIISLMHMSLNDFVQSFPRYFVTFPFILFTIIYKDYSYVFVKKVLRTLCMFMTLASLTVPYQILFGPISFFTEPSIREGVVRYTSLAGSLTALGTLGAFSLVILLFSDNYLFNRKTRNILIVLLVLGMLMSLQKAAIVNIIICFSIYLLINGKVNFIKRILAVVTLCFLVYGIYLIFRESLFGFYIESLFSFSFDEGSSGVEKDLFSRLWERPYGVMEYNNIGIFELLTGVGFSSLGGIMGLNSLQSHNNYFDLIFSGGLFYFGITLCLILSIPVKVILKKIRGLSINIIDRTYCAFIILFLINMAIGAASYYQPITAVFLFFILFSYHTSNHWFNKDNIEFS
ncbi:O-antigen polymerase [Oceanobacillus oncorhynchi]|uniref:O-antigen polymerase n=1 Tax=Oceanobacillus oncorhynchi TaxID=545501 RepID=UPI001867FB74|nr:O-antigen polymerase [Oceanobacillus oncorhynchi]